jgi:hypothetical protein
VGCLEVPEGPLKVPGAPYEGPVGPFQGPEGLPEGAGGSSSRAGGVFFSAGGLPQVPVGPPQVPVGVQNILSVQGKHLAGSRPSYGRRGRDPRRSLLGVRAGGQWSRAGHHGWNPKCSKCSRGTPRRLLGHVPARRGRYPRRYLSIGVGLGPNRREVSELGREVQSWAGMNPRLGREVPKPGPG